TPSWTASEPTPWGCSNGASGPSPGRGRGGGLSANEPSLAEEADPEDAEDGGCQGDQGQQSAAEQDAQELPLRRPGQAEAVGHQAPRGGGGHGQHEERPPHGGQPGPARRRPLAPGPVVSSPRGGGVVGIAPLPARVHHPPAHEPLPVTTCPETPRVPRWSP